MPILISSAVSLYFLEWSDIFKPVLVGFSCRDRSLSLPYTEPAHELVPLLMLLSLAFAAPAISVSPSFCLECLCCSWLCSSPRARGFLLCSDHGGRGRPLLLSVSEELRHRC